MKTGATRRGLGDRLDGADLVVGVLERDDVRAAQVARRPIRPSGSTRTGRGLDVGAATPGRAAPRSARRPSAPRVAPGRSSPSRPRCTASVPDDGERHLVAAYAERLGDRLPGVVEDQPGVAGRGVQPARVGVPLVERGEHRLAGRGVQRLGGRGVEVHARKTTRTGRTRPGRLPRACAWARVSSVLSVGREGLFRGSAARRALGRTARRDRAPGEWLLRAQWARGSRCPIRRPSRASTSCASGRARGSRPWSPAPWSGG